MYSATVHSIFFKRKKHNILLYQFIQTVFSFQMWNSHSYSSVINKYSAPLCINNSFNHNTETPKPYRVCTESQNSPIFSPYFSNLVTIQAFYQSCHMPDFTVLLFSIPLLSQFLAITIGLHVFRGGLNTFKE